MKPYYEHAGITIYHEDCLELLPEIGADCVVTDPPYGMGLDTDYRRFTKLNSRTSNAYPRVVGDDAPFDPSPWLRFPRVLMFGFNHFSDKVPLGTLLVWLKRTDAQLGTFMSDCEVAWMKGGHGVYLRRFCRDGQQHAQRHPTEKPVPIMRWCIELVGGNGIIVDPYMGVGTTLVAAKQLGREAIGIEIEERYCEIAVQRLQQDVLPLFEPEAEAKQIAMR